MNHWPFIAAAYALAALVLGGLSLATLLRHRAAKRRLAALER